MLRQTLTRPSCVLHLNGTYQSHRNHAACKHCARRKQKVIRTDTDSGDDVITRVWQKVMVHHHQDVDVWAHTGETQWLGHFKCSCGTLSRSGWSIRSDDVPPLPSHELQTSGEEQQQSRMLTSNCNPLSSSGIGSQDLFTLSSSLIGSFLLKNQKPVWRTIGRLMVWALVLDGEVKKSWYSVWLESGLDLLFSSDLDQINQFD